MWTALQHRGSGAAFDADTLAIGDEAVASAVPPGAAADRPEPQRRAWPSRRPLSVEGGTLVWQLSRVRGDSQPGAVKCNVVHRAACWPALGLVFVPGLCRAAVPGACALVRFVKDRHRWPFSDGRASQRESTLDKRRGLGGIDGRGGGRGHSPHRRTAGPGALCGADSTRPAESWCSARSTPCWARS
jgi:hypothetical protein